MNICIAGGTGFIGQNLVKHFSQFDHQLTVIGRDKNKIQKTFKNAVSALDWHEFSAQKIADCDLIINLTGANIADRPWTKKRKQVLLNSRLHPTKQIVDALLTFKENPPTLFNASGVGIYGLQEKLDETFSEESPIDFDDNPDFMSQLGHQWEQATWPARDAGIRVVNMRFAPVLDSSGGMLKKMYWPFKFGLGGKMGSGEQPFAWIALTDLIRGINFLIEHKDISGPINCAAPTIITQYEFAQALQQAVKGPFLPSWPEKLLKLMMGQMATELFLTGQSVQPKRLIDAGFEFEYPEINQALQAIYH